jgi:hypothetical protein
LDSAGLVGFLVEFLVGFERVRNRLGLVDHQVVAAVDASTLPDDLVAGSTAHVLTRVTRVSRVEAHRRVHAAEALGQPVSIRGERRPAHHPELAAAVVTGRVPVENVRVAVRCLRRLEHRFYATTEQLAFADGQLTEVAVVFGPEELRRVTQHLEDVLFPDGCLTDDHQVADARDLTLTAKADGSWSVDGRLTGLCGAALSAVLTSLAAPIPGPDGSPDERSPGQRRHDALHTAATMLLRTGDLPRAGGVPASIIVTIDADDLLAGTGHGTTTTGGRLNVAEIIRLADDAELLPTLLTRSLRGGGVPLAMGRTRRCATDTQTKALIARDGGCSFPHCTAPPAWCDRHHVIPWRDQGPTDVDNLTLLCGYHHTYFEQRPWRCQMTNGLPHWTPPRWIDPHQAPILHERIQARFQTRHRE